MVVTMKIWHLTAEIENGGDYNGITTVHHTREGAIKHFEEWLQTTGIPTEIAYNGVQWLNDDFIGADYENGETHLHWGIQPMEVHE